MSESERPTLPDKVDSRRWKPRFKPALAARIRASAETLAILGPEKENS